MNPLHDQLRALLADEHAAIYAYGVLGARLGDRQQVLARTASDAHRAVRDDLRARLARLKLVAPAPAAAYDLAVATSAEAREAAVRVEEQLAVRWRDLVAATDDKALRSLAVQRLQECAVRAASWRQLSGVAPTVPFPGAVSS